MEEKFSLGEAIQSAIIGLVIAGGAMGGFIVFSELMN